MKKTLLVIVGLCFLASPALFAQIWEHNAPKNFRVNIAKNQYASGYNWCEGPNWLLDGNQIKAGEVYELEMTFTSNRAIPKLRVCLVDNTQAVNYWKQLTNPDTSAGDHWILIENIQANVPYTTKVTFNIYNSASSAHRDANKLDFDYEAPTQSSRLEFTQFTFRRIK
jgi:hypothetical protein